jgi:hypothetical protein
MHSNNANISLSVDDVMTVLIRKDLAWKAPESAPINKQYPIHGESSLRKLLTVFSKSPRFSTAAAEFL